MKLNKQWLAIPLMAAMSAALIGCGDGGSEASEGRLDEDNSGNNNGAQRPGVPADQQFQFCNSELSQFDYIDNTLRPKSGEFEVELNRAVSISFNANVDKESVTPETAQLFVESEGVVVFVTTSIDVVGNNVKLTPLEPLQPLTTHTVKFTKDISADCPNADKRVKDEKRTEFTTRAADDPDLGRDAAAPQVVEMLPMDGESLAPIDTSIRIQFNESMDITSVKPATADANNTDFNFKMIAVQANGDPLADAQPVAFESFDFDPESDNTIIFEPAKLLNPSEYYKITLVGKDDVPFGAPTDVPAIRDLAQNEFAETFEYQFRTGSLVVGLNDVVVENIPVLGDVLNTVGGSLLAGLEFGEAEDGLDSADKLAIIKLPLSQDLIQAIDDQDPTGLQDLVDPENSSAFDSVLIAVCDPKSISTGTSQPDCALSVDLGLDATQLATVLASGGIADPVSLPTFFANALTDDNDGLGVEIKALEDDSLPVPAILEDNLNGLLNMLGGIPVLGDILNQADGVELLNAGILDGAIVGVQAGEVVSLDILDAEFLSGGFTEGGLEGGSGLITGSGSLIDLLSGAGPLVQGLCSLRLLCPAETDSGNGEEGNGDAGNGEGSPEPGSPAAELADALAGLTELLNATDFGESLGTLAPTLQNLVAELAAMSPGSFPADPSELTSALTAVTGALSAVAGGFPSNGAPELPASLTDLRDALSALPVPTESFSGLEDLGSLASVVGTLTGILSGLIPG